MLLDEIDDGLVVVVIQNCSTCQAGESVTEGRAMLWPLTLLTQFQLYQDALYQLHRERLMRRPDTTVPGYVAKLQQQ